MKKRIISLSTSFMLLFTFVIAISCLEVSADSSYLWPVSGSQQINQYYSSTHDGLDIGGSTDTPILATMSGVVVAVIDGDVPNKWIGYGKGVVIKHSNGYYSHYAHMNYTSVSINQSVSQGQQIGGMGTTGNSTGTHLHFAIATSMYGAGGRINVNPNKINYIYNIHTHNYTNSITKQPTCTDTGIKTYTCSCGNSYTETIAAKGHNYVNTIIAPTSTEKGYTLHKCSTCGYSYEDNYVDSPIIKEDGWYYCDKLPSDISDDKFTIEYNNYFEKIQTSSPGSDWNNEGVAKSEWQNSGNQYTSPYDLETSDSRVLLSSIYYHFCGPSAGDEGNYELSGKFVHYDWVSANQVTSKYLGDDNGHPYYFIYWPNGTQVYCKSGDTCDSSWGTHSERCRAWYKENTYQDRVNITSYKFTKNSGWVSSADSNASSIKIRYKAKDKIGDVNKDDIVNINDIVELQNFLLAVNENISVNADINKDGVINVFDLSLLKRMISN